ncbi:MAG: hypothetical protein AB8H86_15495 [Polyangiales bacterium]
MIKRLPLLGTLLAIAALTGISAKTSAQTEQAPQEAQQPAPLQQRGAIQQPPQDPAQQQPAQQPPQDPDQQPAQQQQAGVSVEANVAADPVFVAPDPAPAPAQAPAPAPVAQQPQQAYTPPPPAPVMQPTEDEAVTASRSGMIFGAALMGVGLAAVPWWISRRRVLNETCPCLDQQRISRSRWAAVGISLGGLALGGLVFALGVKQRLRARREGLTTLDLEIRGDGLSLSGTF